MKAIARIAIPAIVANIAEPLLALVDLGIAGHLGRTEYIGAMAVAAMMFNLIYWNLGFLRMGASGLTAQAFGRGDREAIVALLWRTVGVATALGIAIIVLQFPLQWIALKIIAPENEVLASARTYFYICVWGAPAVLAVMGIKGWYLGMQDSRIPMLISVGVNVLNILISLMAVYALGMGFAGIAVGTVAAEYIGLAYALWTIWRSHRSVWRGFAWHYMLRFKEMGEFWRVNIHIFFRSSVMMVVTLFFVSAGARQGNVVLAVNSLIMQLFVLYSYFMDGVAFAGEALVGKHLGSGDANALRHCLRRLFIWGAVVMLVFVAIYGGAIEPLLRLLTNDHTVVSAALAYRLWCIAIPLSGMVVFVWDGVYIGLTRTYHMLLSIVAGAAAFFGIYFCGMACGGSVNQWLWAAFICYLIARGAYLTIVTIKKLRFWC